MQTQRLPYLLDRSRWQLCRRLFNQPLRAFFGLSFLQKRPISVALKDGHSLSFSRAGRDHRFWDWFLQNPVPMKFTDDGCVQIAYDGATLDLRPGTTDFVVFEEVFLQDEYGIRQSGKRYGTAIDLGANVGMFSCAIRPQANRVIAVEAVGENHRQAIRNITANDGNPDDVLQRAIAPLSGEAIRIYHNPRNTGGHSTARAWTQRTGESSTEPEYETVETISLADLLDSRGVVFADFLKCDIEGAEYDVFLKTPVDVIGRIGEIAMEVHVSPAHPPHLLRDLVSRLDTAGFEVSLSREIPTTDAIASFMLTARNRCTAPAGRA